VAGVLTGLIIAWTLGDYFFDWLAFMFTVTTSFRGDEELAAIGVDAATGEVRWQHAAGHSWIVPTNTLRIAVSDQLGLVLGHFAPGDDEVAVEVRQFLLVEGDSLAGADPFTISWD
jgi:hypothetical protein